MHFSILNFLLRSDNSYLPCISNSIHPTPNSLQVCQVTGTLNPLKFLLESIKLISLLMVTICRLENTGEETYIDLLGLNLITENPDYILPLSYIEFSLAEIFVKMVPQDGTHKATGIQFSL